jgi:hypothetical protein
MLSLKQAIAEWRLRLIESGVKSPAVLDELESHLRDEIEGQLQLGLPERQAFEIAVDRIGSINILGQEFTREQRFASAALFGGAGLYSLVAGVPALFKLGSFSEISSAQQISALCAVIITTMALFGGRFLGRLLPPVSSLRVRIGIYVFGVVLLLTWLALVYQHIMSRVQWDVSQLVVALLWALSPSGAVCGLPVGMDEVATGTQKAYV